MRIDELLRKSREEIKLYIEDKLHGGSIQRGEDYYSPFSVYKALDLDYEIANRNGWSVSMTLGDGSYILFRFIYKKFDGVATMKVSEAYPYKYSFDTKKCIITDYWKTHYVATLTRVKCSCPFVSMNFVDPNEAVSFLNNYYASSIDIVKDMAIPNITSFGGYNLCIISAIKYYLGTSTLDAKRLSLSLDPTKYWGVSNLETIDWKEVFKNNDTDLSKPTRSYLKLRREIDEEMSEWFNGIRQILADKYNVPIDLIGTYDTSRIKTLDRVRKNYPKLILEDLV